MARRRMWIGICVLAFLLGFPRTGSAGLWDFIVEMSGPQMWGFGGACKFDLANHAKLDRCEVFPGIPLAGDGEADATFRLSVEGAGYFSSGIGRNADLYEKFDVWMLGIDPIVEWQLLGKEHHGLYVGAGGALNYIFNTGFFNAGFKVRPFGFSVPLGRGASVNVEGNLRFYPKEFTPANFGKPEAPFESSGVEVVKGLSLVFHF